jgi:hypothetical protein
MTFKTYEKNLTCLVVVAEWHHTRLWIIRSLVRIPLGCIFCVENNHGMYKSTQYALLCNYWGIEAFVPNRKLYILKRQVSNYNWIVQWLAVDFWNSKNKYHFYIFRWIWVCRYFSHFCAVHVISYDALKKLSKSQCRPFQQNVFAAMK